MEDFVRSSQRLELRGVLAVSIINGGFVAVGIAWKDATAAVVGEWMGTIQSTPSKLLNALVVTLFVCACVFALQWCLSPQMCVGRSKQEAVKPVRTTPLPLR